MLHHYCHSYQAMEVHRKRARSLGGDCSAKRKKQLLLSTPPPPPQTAPAAAANTTASTCTTTTTPPPSKFMFFDKGTWNDFPSDSSGLLREAYARGKDAVRLVLSSCVYIISFARMLQVDADTGYTRSIAWVGEDGELRSPASPFEGPARCRPEEKKKTPNSSLLTAPAAAAGAAAADSSTGEVVDDLKSVANSGLRKLEASEPAYAEVEGLFLGGLGVFSPAALVTGVFEVSYGGSSWGSARREAFESRVELTGRLRGDSNVQYAWYGCPREELAMIIQHGFGRPSPDSSFGVGVYLAPEKLSRLSCVGADVDENGEQQVLLCRVILGNSEPVQPGSSQFHPSSEEFDTGVDNLAEPKKLIVWSTHMNTHILPLFVASFKLPKEWHEVVEAFAGKPRGNKPTLVAAAQGLMKPKGVEKASAIPKLLAVLKPELSATEMSLLEADYVDHKNGKISREDFLKRVRSLAGDQTLKKLVQRSGLLAQNNKLSELSSNRSTIAR